jgi:hypothetical protein
MTLECEYRLIISTRFIFKRWIRILVGFDVYHYHCQIVQLRVTICFSFL